MRILLFLAISAVLFPPNLKGESSRGICSLFLGKIAAQTDLHPVRLGFGTRAAFAASHGLTPGFDHDHVAPGLALNFVAT
jgi:hypothetical protein